jgi:hypothetical protein
LTTDASAEEGVVKTYSVEEHITEVQKAVSGATSRIDRENSALTKQIASVTEERDAARAESAQLKSENGTLKKAADLSDDVTAWTTFQASEEARLQRERSQLNTDARTMHIERLQREFDGLNPEILKTLDTPQEMEIYALRIHAANVAAAGTESAKTATTTDAGIDGGTTSATQGTQDSVQIPQADRGVGNGTAAPAASKLSPLDKITQGLADRDDTPDADKA